MKSIKLWGPLAILAMVAGTAGAASAQEVSTTAGFQLGFGGGVTAMTVSSAVSDTFAHSSGVINTGGVYTEAFASDTNFGFFALQAPLAIELGVNVNPFVGDTVVIGFPGGGGAIIAP